MHVRSTMLATTVAAVVLALGSPGYAQAAGANSSSDSRGKASATKREQGTTQQREVARACLDDLQAFDRTAGNDGYWIYGWGSRWGYGPAGRAQPIAAPSRSATRDARGTSASNPRNDGSSSRAADGASKDTGAGSMQSAYGPWGDERWGMTSPRHQIRALRSAAAVLAHRGDRQGCEAVMNSLHQVYDQYVRQLKEAGVAPGEVTTWRQEQIVAARPIEKLERRLITVADINGMEIRNGKDEQLGTVEDVVMNPSTGGIRYVIVSSGGLFGIGNEFVAVPWSALEATPGLNTLVLDVTQDVIDKAPKVDPDRFANPSRTADHRKAVDDFWKDQLPS